VVQTEYEVRALGTLPASADVEFRRLVVANRPVETILHAPVSSASALVSLLTRLENLGLNVVAFRQLNPGAEYDGPERQGVGRCGNAWSPSRY
jgi:hypothetical protein